MNNIQLQILFVLTSLYLFATIWGIALRREKLQDVRVSCQGLALAGNYMSQSMCCAISAIWFFIASVCFSGIASEFVIMGLMYTADGVVLYTLYTLFRGLMCGFMLDLD